MDSVNEEGCLPHDEASPGPPTLIGCPLDFGYVSQGSQKTLQQIIANTTKKPMIWLADAGESRWLSVEPDHGILQPGARQPIRVTADTRTLEVGEHSVTLTFSSEGDETSMSTGILSKVKVGKPARPPDPPPLLPLGAGLHFGWLKPQSTSTLELIINNPNDHSVDWEIRIGNGKLGIAERETLEHGRRTPGIKENFSMKKAGGVIPSKSQDTLEPYMSQTIYVTASAAKLKPGYSYTANLTLISKPKGSNGTSTSAQVPVTFHVTTHPYNDGGPKVPYDLPSHISITIPRQQPNGTSTLSFTNNNSSTVYWTLDSPPNPPLPSWLVPNLLSGTFKANDTNSVVLTAQRAGLNIGPYKAQLYLTFEWVDQNNLPIGVRTAAPPIPVFLTVE